MANLKGGSFEKQIRDANFRLDAFGHSRHANNSHKTHSDATRIKRDGYWKDFGNRSIGDDSDKKAEGVWALLEKDFIGKKYEYDDFRVFNIGHETWGGIDVAFRIIIHEDLVNTIKIDRYDNPLRYEKWTETLM